MKIVGYTDRLSVQPGETIRFMVSCELPKYQADIVRLIHGDVNPKGPGFKEELVQTPVSGEYAGRKQVLDKGSYAVVPDNPLLPLKGGFTLQAWIYPTTPQKGVQGIITKWSAPDEVGYGLFIDKGGELALWIGNKKSSAQRVRTGKPLRASTWYFVAGVYDLESRKVLLYQEPVTAWPSDDTEVLLEEATRIGEVGGNDAPLLMAGYSGQVDSGKTVVAGKFNGKIESPRLYGRGLNHGEIEALKQGASPQAIDGALIAAWDFSTDIASTKVTDTSSHQQHGQTVNMPARAMTGYNWTGNETDFKRAPEEYGAIHFHDDDFDDAGWEVDFELAVPAELKSGVYAARLRGGDSEDYVPFFVRPRRGTTTARIALLMPTLSYLAYANENLTRKEIEDPVWGLPADFSYPVLEQDKYIIEQGLVSLYSVHTDGSGVCYSSRLHPILTIRPKYHNSVFGGGLGAPHQFNADMHLVDWLEAKGHKYDVITDEDLHWEGADLLAPYKVVVSGSHPEYWTRQMLDALETYLRSGGRAMYLGGNGFYWITSIDPEGRHTIEVRRWGGTMAWDAAPGEYYHSTTGEIGGIWKRRGQAPQKMMGVGFTSQGFDRNVPYRRQPGSFDPRASFIFEGIGQDELIGDFPSLVMEYGAAGFELDRVDYALGTPPHTLLLATSTGHSDSYQHVLEELLQSDSRQGGTVDPKVKSDMVYVPYPKGGAVFSVGSISWCGSLSYNSYDNTVSRVTDNVLSAFASVEELP